MPDDTVQAQIDALAELIVRFGANVQPGQIVAIGSEPGKEALTRAIAASAYQAGAKFVDVSVFDIHVKRARVMYAEPETLEFVPPWYGARMRALGENRCAVISLTGPVAPRIMDGVDPARLGRDMLPRLRESIEIVNRAHDELDRRSLPHPGVGRARPPRLHAGRGARAPVA